MNKETGTTTMHSGINWTVIFAVVAIAMIFIIGGPIVYRLVILASEDDMRVIGIILVVLLIFAVFVLALIGAVLAFSRMALRFLQQDDADEVRKAQQLNSQLARAAGSALRGQQSALSEREQAAQMFQEAWGRQREMAGDGNGGYREGIGQDMELG